MGGFAGVIAVGAGAVDFPVETCGKGLLLKYAFRQWAAADVAKTDEENFHGGQRGKKCGEIRGRGGGDGGARIRNAGR